MVNGDRFVDPGRLPSAEQLLLIKAALLPGPEGHAAGSAWFANADIDRLGKASGRLLPLLYNRLRDEGVDHPLLPMLKGVKRHAWYYNQMLFHRASEAIRALGEAGIESMLIKGAAMAIEYYRDWSLRPMDDVDVLVHCKDASTAIQLLRSRGWKSADPWFEQNGYSALTRKYEHAMLFPHSSGQAMDLHWNLLKFCIGPKQDDDFWNASKGTLFDGQPVRILDPADQLLHILVHGTPWEMLAPIRWIPDAVILIRASSDLDWDRFIFQTRKRRLTLEIAGALEYLQSCFCDLLPSGLLDAVHRIPVSSFEKLEYSGILEPVTGVIEATVSHLCRYWRLSEGSPFWKLAPSFPTFLCCQFRVVRKWQLLAVLCNNILGKIVSRPQNQTG
jgi:hypothetical protein